MGGFGGVGGIYPGDIFKKQVARDVGTKKFFLIKFLKLMIIEACLLWIWILCHS